jgi:hypothetical protein
MDDDNSVINRGIRLAMMPRLSVLIFRNERKIMKLFAGVTGLALLVVFASSAQAGSIDGNAVLGGALGGGAGAAVGSAIGGREGAIIGGAIGGAAGTAAMASDRREPRVRQSEVYYDDDRHDNGRHRGQHKQKNRHRHGND